MNSFFVALNNLKRNIGMTVSSILLVFLTILVTGAAILTFININHISDEMVNNLTLYVRMQPDVDEAKRQEVEQQIRQVAPVASITLQTKEELLNDYSAQISGNDENKRNSMLNLFSGDKNPLVDQYVVQLVEGDQIETIANQLAQIPNVKNVGYGDPTATNNFIDTLHKISLGCAIAGALLLAASIVIIMNTIHLTINSRNKEIEIMRLVGATKWYVRMPFVWEGVLFGFFGGTVAIVILLLGYYNIYQTSGGYISQMLIPFNQLALPITLLLYLTSVLIGALGSIISTQRYLQK